MKRLIVVLALLTSGCGFSGLEQLPLPGGPDVGKHSYVVTADFDDVLNLTRDSTVKSDGVTIGRVEKVERRGWKARLVLRLNGDVKLPAGTRAHIAQTSLLGEKFVDMQAPASGGDGLLVNGSNIPVARTSRGSEVEEVLGALSLLLNGGGVAQLKTISTELHEALDPTSVDTVRFIQQLDTFVGTLDRNRDSIIATLEHLNSLSQTVNSDRRAVKAALRDIGPGLDVLAKQQKQLTSMLSHLDSFSQVSSNVITRAGDDLTADLRALAPTLAALAKSGESLPKALEVILTFPFPDAVLNAVKGDYVNLDVLLDLSPLEILKNASGGLVDTTGLPSLIGGLTTTTKTPGSTASSPAAPKPTAAPAPGGGLLGLLLGQGR